MLKIELDLDKIWSGDEWNTTIGEIMREEIKFVVRKEISKALKESTELKKAIIALQKRAAAQLLKEIKE